MADDAGGLIGRDGDIRAVLAALNQSRLVTLTGPGGVGKTRLAQEVASELDTEFDRVIFIDLTVGASQRGGPLATDLGLSKTLLLVDNCEHVIEDAAVMVSDVMSTSKSATVLATSRRPLHVAGERLHHVVPLAIPQLGEPISDLIAYDAVQLFLERATELDASFELTEQEIEPVTRICRLSDGLPIAIELAAGLTRSRSTAAIADAMDHGGSRDLAVKRRDIPDHQQSLARSISWSVDLLDPDARQLLQCAAVFRGTFSALSIQRVHQSIGGKNTASLLDLLVEHSLASFNKTTERFTLLALVASGVRDSTDPDLAESLEMAHRSWALETSETISNRATQPDPLDTFPQFQHDLPDLSFAADRLMRSDKTELWLELVGPIAEWWVHHGGAVDRTAWEAALDDQLAGDARQVSLANGLAFHLSHLGDHPASLHLALEAHAAASTCGRDDLAISALVALGNAQQSLGRHNEAARSFAEACALNLSTPNPYLSSLARLCLARTATGSSRRGGLIESLEMAGSDHPAIRVMAELELARYEVGEGNVSDASRWAADGVQTAARLGFPEAEATAQNTLGAIALLNSQLGDANRSYQNGIIIGQRIGHSGVVADGLLGLARVLMRRELADRANQVAKLAFELAPTLPVPPALVGAAEAADQAFPIQDLQELFSILDSEEHDSQSEPAALLTGRETSVLLLLRGDLTQRQIADELYISASTVRTHVKSIYRKLGVHNRSGCVHHATVLGLLPPP